MRRLGNRFDELVDDMLRRRHIGITHAEVDNVLAARPRGRLQSIDLFKDVRRQPFYAVEILHEWAPRPFHCLNSTDEISPNSARASRKTFENAAA